MYSEPGAAKILAVSWAMPPILSPRSIQVPRTLRALAELGWDTTVLHADRITAGGRFPTDGALAEVYRGAYRAVAVRPPAWLPLLRSNLGTRLLSGLGWSERAWKSWAIRAACRLQCRERFPLLLTFGQPWVDHLVGMALHTDSGVPWVAHFSDPWADSPFLAPSDPRCQLWRQQEEAVIRAATAVVFVTAETLDLVMRKYPRTWREKARVVPHGYDPDLLDAHQPARRNARLRMVSTGTFYGDRTPVPLLHALVDLENRHVLLDDLEVLLVGARSDFFAGMARQMGLGQVVEGRPPVPFLDSLRIARQADVLLLIDAPSKDVSVFLPSKLVDYLMLGKPVFGITPPSGASATLLERLECPVASPDDVAGIAGAIEKLLSAWRAGSLSVSPAFSGAAQQYDIRQTTRILHDLLCEVSGLGPGHPRDRLAGRGSVQ